MILRRARGLLTLGFTLVQLVTYGILAVSVYTYVTGAFDFDAVEDSGYAPTAEAGFATLRTALILAFVCLLVLAPLSSWLLAGLAMRPIAATLAAQRRFVDDASHELRTPLTAIQGQLELALLRPRSAAEYREACVRALDATQALAATAEDLIVAAEGPSASVAGGDADVVDVVHRAGGLMADPSRFHVEVRDRPRVAAPAAAVQRVLVNVMVNASRYSAADTPVIVRVERRRRRAVVEIADRGNGMTREQARRAFDRFWQADPSRGAQGSGLGLSIVRDILTSLHGDVSLRSRPGIGTTVRVRLPLSRSSHTAAPTVETTDHPF